MAELRTVLTDAGFENVRTYLQSGNVVLSSTRSADRVARDCERQIADALGLAELDDGDEAPRAGRRELAGDERCEPLDAFVDQRLVHEAEREAHGIGASPVREEERSRDDADLALDGARRERDGVAGALRQ